MSRNTILGWVVAAILILVLLILWVHFVDFHIK